MKPTDLALRLKGFLGEYLPTERKLSSNTIRGYRDAFVLLLRYCREIRKLRVERLDLDQIGTELVVDFLEHLEHERRCSPATRNHRLTAIHSFFRYVQTEEPERLLQCQRILAIPLRRINHAEPTYLSDKDLAVLLRQPDCSTRDGLRDAVLLSVLYDTGARVQELIDLRVQDLRLETPTMVRLMGKGRKTRLVPLMPSTVEALKHYLQEEELDAPERVNTPLFRNRQGAPFSRWGIRYLLAKYSQRARVETSSLPSKVTPHTLRHNTETSITLRESSVKGIYRWSACARGSVLRIIGVVRGQRQTYSRGGRVGADRLVMFMARRLLETRESAKS